MMVELIDAAVADGARAKQACEVVGISLRTVERWRAAPEGGDQRKGPLTPPSHKLTPEERALLLETANQPEFRDKSPRQIVPMLADRGRYIASESTFYRVLEEEGQLNHRERSRPATPRKPRQHVARAPNEVWCWDITYLRSSVRGAFYYLYLIVDIYSRKIVGWRVEREESMEHAAELLRHAARDEKVDTRKLVLHADNGGPMRGSTMLATLHKLGILASFSRPRVSDDNPYAEALFRTLKYRPGYPRRPFESTEEAAQWVRGFVDWYNNEHLHSAIRYVTPNQRHLGWDAQMLVARHNVYKLASARNPARGTGKTRNWSPAGPVVLNPEANASRIH
jgi:putative transposase